jgi:DcuC family C4-dicarboxylate transporter
MLIAVQDSPVTPWQQLGGVVVIALAVLAIVRRVDVRLSLLMGAFALGAVAGQADVVLRTLLGTLADERFVVPICTALGFSYVLRHTGCDQHLVHALVRPLARVRFLLIPGTVLVGYVVNMPVVSQAATATAIGPVVVPLLRAANISPVTTGAALLLGSSIGGELLNPGAPELRATIAKSKEAAAELNEQRRDQGLPLIDADAFDSERCVQRVLPLSLVGLVVATGVFWVTSVRYERRAARRRGEPAAPPDTFRVNPIKAAVPLLPLVLLYLASPPIEVIDVPRTWLEATSADEGRFETRLIGAAMLLGAVVAVLAAPRGGPGATAAFFEGAGYGYAHVISPIAAANCFGAGIRAIGLAEVLGRFTQDQPALLLVSAAVLPLAFAALCGSGMAATQSLVGFFTRPALLAGIDPTHAGAVVSLAAAAGRTMSPAAAVAMISAEMTGTLPLRLCRRVLVPLLLGTAALTAVAMALAPAP